MLRLSAKKLCEIIIKEIDFIGNPSNTYSTANRFSAEVIDNNLESSTCLGSTCNILDSKDE